MGKHAAWAYGKRRCCPPFSPSLTADAEVPQTEKDTVPLPVASHLQMKPFLVVLRKVPH